jgi:hypothetical protein
MAKKVATTGLDPTHVWIGKLACGCVVAFHIDYQDESTGESVSSFIQSGYEVSRVSINEAPPIPTMCADHSVATRGERM